MQLFFVDTRRALRAGGVPGISPDELGGLFARRLVPAGTPVVLDDAMRPVEPVSSWLGHLGLVGRSPKTMRAYAYAVLRLVEFLASRGTDVLGAVESDLWEYRHWRTEVADDPVAAATWEKESAAINGLFGWLVERGYRTARPWRSVGRRDSLRNGVTRDMRVRHMTLEQYLFFRDVGLGGLTLGAEVDGSFRGWCPHRNRAGAELALLTGMRLQEWSTVLLPELGVGWARSGEPVEFELGACAKFGRPRTVYVPPAALDLVGTYLLLERPAMVAAARRRVAAERDGLFVVDDVDYEHGRLRGVLAGRQVSRRISEMGPELRAVTVFDIGAGLEPLSVFVGHRGTVLGPSSWDKIRWRAWARMRACAGEASAPPLPARCWAFHDLRHTFALRLLMFLTQQAVRGGAGEGPWSTLADHVAYNPLLVVQRRLGHASPATTYHYLRYLKDPISEVAEAFGDWTAFDGASYAEVASRLLGLEEASDAAAG